MKSCPYCGAEYTDDVTSCLIDHHPVSASVPRPDLTIPLWLKSLVSRCWRRYRSQPRKRKLKIAGLGSATFLAVYILSTSQYSYYEVLGVGNFRISKPPLFMITIGPTRCWRVQSGINFVPDSGLVEFPLCPGYRVGIDYFTRSRWRQWRQYHGRRSLNH